MFYVALGATLTYAITPLIAYAWVSRLDPACTKPQAAVLSLSIGPIAISFFLFVLLHLFPRQSNTFYLLAVLGILVGFTATLPGFRQALSRALDRRTVRASLAHISTLPDSPLGGVVFAVVRLALLSVALTAFAGPLSKSGIFIVDTFASAVWWLLLLIAAGLALREVVTLARSLYPLLKDQLGPDGLFLLLRPQVVARAIWAWGLIIAVAIGGFVLLAGLVNVIVDNDPLEYLVVSRAIFDAKSLSIYPIVTGLPESGLHAPSSHPPAFLLLDFWAFLFDGPDSTRLTRLAPLFYFTTLLGTLYAYLRPFGLIAAVLGPLLLLSVPLLSDMAVISHIDPMRIAFFALAVFVTASSMGHASAGKEIICGIVWGLLLYSHSLGLFGAFICATTYFLLDNRNLFSRTRSLTVILSIAACVGGSQYLINIIAYGAPFQDSTIVWQVPSLQEAKDLAYRRVLGTPEDILTRGLFQNFRQREMFGPTQLPELLAIVFGARLLWSSSLGRTLLLSVFLFYAVLCVTVIFGSLAAVKNPRYLLTVAPLLSAATAIVLGILACRAIGGAEHPNGAPSFSYIKQTYLFLLILACPTLVAAVGTDMRSRISGSRAVALVWEKRDRDFIYDERYAYGPLMRFFARHLRGKVLVFRQSDFAFFGRPPWVDYLDPSLVDFYQTTDKYKAHGMLIARGIEFFFIPGASSQPTAYYRTAAIEIASDPELSEIVAIAEAGTVVRLLQQRREVQCRSTPPRTVSTIEWAPLNVGNLTARIFHRHTRPTVARELAFTEYAALNSKGMPQTPHQLVKIDFSAIDVPQDASLSEFVVGMQRMQLAMDLAGEGLAEITMQVFGGRGAFLTRGLWTGLLENGGRRVALQTVVPAGAREIRLSVNKFQGTVGHLNVGQVRVCQFQGPPTLQP